MEKIIKSKCFMAIVVVIVASSLFLISFGITRFIINKSVTKQASQEEQVQSYDSKKEKQKFIEENIKDEDTKNAIILQDNIDEAIKVAEENGEDPMEAVAEVLKEQNYTDEYKEYLKLSDEEKKEVEVIPREQKVDESQFEDIKKDQDEDLGEVTDEQLKEELPEKFDLRDKIDIKVENQGEYGLCWDFAANNAFETSLALTEGKYYDFSESYIDYVTSIELNTDSTHRIHGGGNFDLWIDYASEGGKFVLEDEAEYRDYKEEEWICFFNMDTVDDAIVSNVVAYPDFTQEKVGKERFEEYQNIVKRHIKNYGGLMASIYIDNQKDVFFSDKNKTANHGICIIGWDDNYSKENFKDQNGNMPNHNGAYIVLNSWGENSGYNGYIYVSYEDVTVNKEMYGIMISDNESLIKLSDIGNKPIEDFIKERCDIVLIDGEEYVRQISLDSITGVDLKNRSLKSLKGIEYFTNVYSINISNNNIQDISELQNCEKLRYVFASNNKIKDVSVLQNCPELYSLDISGNENVSGYEFCDSLEHLYLNDCNIESVESINNLQKLVRLEISNNKNISDMEKLDIKNIYELSLSGTNFKQLDKLSTSDGKVWEELDLSYNDITSIEELNNNIAIYSLNLSGNKEIKDYSKLNSMDITCLYLKDCGIENISVLPVENSEIYSLDISNNDIDEEFSNLSTMYNLKDLIMENCYIEDISEISKLNNIKCLHLENNKGIKGDLRGVNLKYIYLSDCNLDSDFDFFNGVNCLYWKLDGNNVDFSKLDGDKIVTVELDGLINEEFISSLPKNINVRGVTEEKMLYIPNNQNINLYTYELGGNGKIEYISEINSKKRIFKLPHKFDLSSLDSFSTRTRNGNPVIYKVIKNDNYPEARDVKVTKYQQKFNNIEDANIDNLVVEEKLYDGVYIETSNYTTNYNKNNLKGGKNYIIVYWNNVEKMIAISIADEDGYVTLKFNSEELFNLVKNWSNVITDNNTRTVKINRSTIARMEEEKAYIRIPYEVLYDIDSLAGIDIKQITIAFTAENSDDDKIEEEDLEKLKVFKNLKRIIIYDETGMRTEESSIVEQDLFKVSFFSNRSYEDTMELTFNDGLLYNTIKKKINGIVYDNQSDIYILKLLPEQVKSLENDSDDYITIKYESLYDIDSLTQLKIQSLGIDFSGDVDQKITEEELLKLNQFESLQTLYLIDNSGVRQKEDMIVDQDRYTVYINGELYQERAENDKNEYTNRIDINNLDVNNITYDYNNVNNSVSVNIY